jgi:GNAT superfamily N-acetyltransferase
MALFQPTRRRVNSRRPFEGPNDAPACGTEQGVNLFDADPVRAGERFETLLSRRNVVIERIVSAAYEDGEVYTQPQDEWVVLLRGEATLQMEDASQDANPERVSSRGDADPGSARHADGDGASVARPVLSADSIALRSGDAVYIPARRRHRVTKCSGDAIWLAVHIHATRPPASCSIEDATPERIAAMCAEVPELSATTAETIASRVGLRRALMQVAVIDGEDAGFKVGYADTPERFYSWIGGVRPAFRRRGVALRLLESQHAWCAAEGFETIEVKTYNRFRGMLMMLMRAGYEVFAVQANGAIVLRRSLTAELVPGTP